MPRLENININGKRVLVRGDLDTDRFELTDYRLKSMVPTLDYLKEHGANIILMGHRGRPEGKVDEKLSLKPFGKVFEKWRVEILENLRFDPREEENDESFARELAAKGDVYVNEAFSTSHREHTSFVGVPKFLPHAAGLHFTKEVENLSRVLENPKKPVVAIISGVKQDKLTYIDGVKKFADKILIGGRLPEYIHDASPLRKDEKLVVGSLIVDKEDISMSTVEKFEAEIAKAGTVVVSGPVGKFEDAGHQQGTKRVFEAVVNSSAFKVAGGGETQEALAMLGLEEHIDWISVGGGAMLQFLASGTLPGIQALVN